MPTRLLTLRDVSDEEADEIRALLEANGIDFYETPASNWGISAGAIWIRDGGPVERARALCDDYQAERVRVVRQKAAELRRSGQAETLLRRLRRDPVRAVIYLAVALLVLYLSTIPFLNFGG